MYSASVSPEPAASDRALTQTRIGRRVYSADRRTLSTKADSSLGSRSSSPQSRSLFSFTTLLLPCAPPPFLSW